MRGRRSFQAFRTSRRRSSSGPIRITYVPQGAAGGPCVAFAVSRKVGGAVVRNRVRRRLRAVCSSNAERLPAGNYLISTAPEVAALSYAELEGAVLSAAERCTAGRPS